MERKIISNIWDRLTRNDLNDMFEYLFGGLGDARNAQKQLDELKNSAFKKTRNLFRGSYTDGLLVRVFNEDNQYVYTFRKNYDGYRGKTAVIEVTPGKNYTAKVHGGESNVLRIGLSANLVDPESGESAKLDEYVYFTSAGSYSNREHTFRVPANMRYVYIYVSNEGKEPQLQLEEGNSATSYVPAYEIPISWESLGGLPDETVTPNKTTFFTSSKNLFDGAYHDNLVIYNPSDPMPQVNSTSTPDTYGVVVPIEPGKTYTVTKFEGGNRFVVLTLPDYPSASLLPMKGIYHHRGNDSANKQTHTFTNTSAKYLFLATNFRSPVIPNVQVEVGSSSTNFEEPSKIPRQFLDVPEFEGVEKDFKFNFYANLNQLFRMKEPIEGYFEDPSNLTVAEYHSAFNTLISAHSEIAKRTKLGDVTGGHPLYKYEIKPADYWVEYTNDSGGNGGRVGPIPKIFITTGIHGNERSPNISAYYLFKEILENPTGNELLDFLKLNVHIILIPLSNPSGWTAKTYNNGNNKNLNRQFPPNIESPTESEAVLIKNQIDANKDLDLFIDFHNMFFRDGYLGYTLTNTEVFKRSMNILYRNLGYAWSREYSEMPQGLSHVWGYNARPNNGTVGNYVESEIKKDAALIEVIRENQWIGDGDFGESIARLGVEMLVNSIIGVLRTKL